MAEMPIATKNTLGDKLSGSGAFFASKYVQCLEF